MKIVSLNVEGISRYELTLPFLESSRADVICLQEATPLYEESLGKLGYKVEFLPSCTKTVGTDTFVDGILIASKHKASFATHRYFVFPEQDLPSENRHSTSERNGRHCGLILATVQYNATAYLIGTTHFTWTPDGHKPNEAQQTDMVSFLNYTKKQSPHIMLGDFNIPRGHNHLYEKLTTIYTDAVPPNYQTSLDKELHRCGTDPSKNHLFEKFMVDYIFTQSPYRAENVSLKFGLSDHAAIIADVIKG